MTYKEFIKLEVERASNNSWFTLDGNSPLAVSNRGFLSELKKQVRGFNYDIANAVDFKELAVQLLSLVMLVTIPFTYLLFLILRTYAIRKKSIREMKARFNKQTEGE